MRRVVVTGIGAVTPLGNSFCESWQRVKAGLSGIERITRFDPSNLRWTVAGQLKAFNALTFLARKEVLRLDPFVHYAIAAGEMAAHDAGLAQQPAIHERPPHPASESCRLKTDCITSAGVIIGSSRGGISTIERETRKLGRARISPYLMPATTISIAASSVAEKLGIPGPCIGVSNACGSGTVAIGEAFRMIRHGYADIVLAGGSEAPLCRLCIEGYGSAGALSAIDDASASRPFDSRRDGFVLAEGACILVLEALESALTRRANLYGEIRGYHTATDAYHMTRPHAEGEARSLMSVLKDAGITPHDVDYVSAHATSTIIGDRTEACAIRAVFEGSPVPVSALKSMTGHMLAASGAFEAACALMTIREGTLPPTINLNEKDPECDLPIVTQRTEGSIKTVLCNSFGFGGVKAVLVLSDV